MGIGEKDGNYRLYSLSEGIEHGVSYLNYLRAHKKFKKSKNIVPRIFYAFNLKRKLDKCIKILPEDAKKAFSRVYNVDFSKKTLKEILLVD